MTLSGALLRKPLSNYEEDRMECPRGRNWLRDLCCPCKDACVNWGRKLLLQENNNKQNWIQQIHCLMLGFLDRWWWAVLSARLSGCSRSVPFCICFRDILQRQIPFTTTYVLAPSLAHLLTCFLGAVWKPLVWKHVKVFSFRMWLWCCVLNF